MDTQKPSKNLIESSLFEKSKNEITTNIKLLDDILNGITHLIACQPEEFPLLDKLGTRTAKSKQINDIPPLTLFFKEYEQHIVLLDVAIDPDELPL